jgi:hypothetical protein
VIRMVSGSTREAPPICQVTAAIRPRAETFTPSSSAPNQVELRRRGMRGLDSAT